MKTADIKAQAQAKVDFSITFTLTKGEAMALNAITEYGTDSFLEVFYKSLGSSGLQTQEQNLRDLFDRIRKELPPEIKKISTAQQVIGEALRALK